MGRDVEGSGGGPVRGPVRGLEGARSTTTWQRLSGLWAESRTWNFSTTKQQCCQLDVWPCMSRMVFPQTEGTTQSRGVRYQGDGVDIGLWHWGEERHVCLKWRDRCGYLEGGERIILKCYEEERWEGCIGLMWLRIGPGEGLLARRWAFGFHKLQGISWLAEKLSVRKEGLSCMQSFSYWKEASWRGTPLLLVSSRHDCQRMDCRRLDSTSPPDVDWCAGNILHDAM